MVKKEMICSIRMDKHTGVIILKAVPLLYKGDVSLQTWHFPGRVLWAGSRDGWQRRPGI